MIRINEVNYHVDIFGQGEPLLFLHGFTGDISTWEKVKKYFSDHYQLIMIDIIGHGKTESPDDKNRYHIDRVASDIHEIITYLKIEMFSLIGYSMGGRVALTYALKYPNKLKKLILESATPGLKTEEERFLRRNQDELIANKILEEGLEAFVEYWTEIPLFQTQKKLEKTIQDEIKRQRLQNHPLGLANSLKGMGTGSMPSCWEHLYRLEMPVCVITGSLDRKFCKIADDMKKLIPNLTHETVNQVGHAIHVEDSQKFGTIVREFLSK